MEKLEHDVFIKGQIVDLVCLDEELALNSNWYKWFNDEEITRRTRHHQYPNTRHKQLEFYRNEIENSKTKLQLGVLHKEDNILIGVVSLNEIDFFNRQCDIVGLIGEKKYHNINSTVEMFRLLIKHAFDNLNMHRIYGGTIIKEVSVMFCRVLGFSLEGVARKSIYKNGTYHDGYMIALLREEYYSKQT